MTDDAPLTPEPVTTRDLEKVVGYKLTGKAVVMHGERTWWKHGDDWYCYDESPDGSPE